MWASPCIENGFYVKLEGEPNLCGKLSKLESVNSEGVMTDACATAMDAFMILSCHQCACNLVEEFVCAKGFAFES